VSNLLEFVSEIERISKAGYIELPTKLNDNLVFGCDEDDVGHKWWFEFDDVKNQLLYSEKVDVLEKFVTVGQIWKFQKFFEDSLLLQIYWEEKINLARGQSFKFDKKIYFLSLVRKYFSKKFRNFLSRKKNS
jgi:hypothetical protein